MHHWHIDADGNSRTAPPDLEGGQTTDYILKRFLPLLIFFCCVENAACLVAAERVSFERDVMAVLSKSGCNMGACHGNQNGKGGFKLSLRGQDPQADFLMLTRDLQGRRANSIDPDSSLILQKPSMAVAHEGGLRFRRDSLEYQLIRKWLVAGLPADASQAPRLKSLEVSPTTVVLQEPETSVRLTAKAHWSDGTVQDVTRLAVFEASTPAVTVSLEGVALRTGFGEATIVVRYLGLQQPVSVAWMARREHFQWTGPQPANLIDVAVLSKLQRLQINPAEICDDTTFLRRACLDLTGAIPSIAEARDFTTDPRSAKRSLLIERLLQSKSYADWWALKWSDMLRNEEKTLDRKGVQNFHAWIRESVAADKPLNQFVRELIASRGSSYVHPESNFYRALREPFARAEATAQLFLGTRLQCAKCHNHPFDKWTQDDYYSWGNLFARVDYKILENNRRDTNDSHEFDGEQIIFMKSAGDVNDPRIQQPRPPRFLGASKPVPESADRLEALAEWLTQPSNRQFARTMVNRVWSQLMGRGIVEPVDDFRATNPPVNAELLEGLTDDFIQHGFSLKHLVRTIANSRTYQLSAVPNETNRDDETNFSRSQVRRLTAEQLLDAIADVASSKLKFSGYPSDWTAKELPGVFGVRSKDRSRTSGDQFLKVFGKPQRLQSCECERVAESTLNQAFQLVSGELINEMLSRRGNRLAEFAADTQRSNSDLITELFWSALSRAPNPAELDTFKRSLDSAADRRQTLEDITWGILNSDEFLLRR
jgi:hypothetical protein